MQDRAGGAGCRDDSPSRGRFRRLKPGPGQPADAVEDDQRRRLRRALTELAAADGFDAVSVRSLTKLAGVSSHTFYERFDGKESCLRAAYASVAERLRHDLLASRDPSISSEVQLGRTLIALSRSLFEDPAGARLALVEIYSGGPAALAAVVTQESSMAAAFRECLDRRERRAPATAARWILDGVLHVARRAAVDDRTGLSPAELRSLASWADRLLGAPPVPASTARPRVADSRPKSNQSGERAALLNATVRLAIEHGYWTLSPASISRRAGVARRAFRHQFSSVEDSYLEALRTLSEDFLSAPDAAGIWRRLAANPDLARLTFYGILDAGRPGLLLRQSLIGDVAGRWRRESPSEGCPPVLDFEATVAALWSSLAVELDSEGAALDSGRVESLHRLIEQGTSAGTSDLLPVDSPPRHRPNAPAEKPPTGCT